MLTWAGTYDLYRRPYTKITLNETFFTDNNRFAPACRRDGAEQKRERESYNQGVERGDIFRCQSAGPPDNIQ